MSKENQVLHSHLAATQRASAKNCVALSRLNRKQETVTIENEELDSKLLELENCSDACVTLLEKELRI